jgi:hypothetical protein
MVSCPQVNGNNQGEGAGDVDKIVKMIRIEFRDRSS